MAAFTFDCQRCGAPIMAAEDMVGRRGRCPHCSTIFSIPDPQTAIAPSALPLRVPAAPDLDRSGPGWREIDVDDVPRGGTSGSGASRGGASHGGASRQSRRDDDFDDDDFDAPYQREPRGLAHLAPGWATVCGGLSLMRTGMIILIIVSLVIALFFILALASRGGFMNRQAEMLMGIFLFVCALTGLVAYILFIVGQCMCCAAPPESGAKGPAVGSVICLFIGVGLWLVGVLFLIVGADRIGRVRGEGPMVMGIGLWLLTSVLFIVSHVLLVMFLRNVGRCFRNSQLTSGTGTYLIMTGVFVGFFLLAMFLTAIMSSAAGRQPDQAALGALLVILGVGLAIFALVLLLYFLDLLARARRAITLATEARG